ncbi:unnamed protein product, partial [Ranitomeya imitator]
HKDNKYSEKEFYIFIDQKLGEFLINLHPTIPVFYILPKVHNNLWNPPGRPIVASTNTILSHLAITFDRILTPLLTLITSYLKDTSDLLTKLNSIGPVPPGCLLVTLDVDSLYTCIAHDRGTEAVQQFLIKHTTFSVSQVDFCLRILHLILHRNFFLFSDQFYIQKTGTAMGSNMAPLMLISLCQYLKKCTFISMEKNGTLDIDIYTKPTDKNSLLFYTSCHPKHVKKSLLKSQFKRVAQIVSDAFKRSIRMEEMANKFQKRGYPNEILTIY